MNDSAIIAEQAAEEAEGLLIQRKIPEALAALNRAVKLAPRSNTYRYKRAVAKAQSGMLDQAAAELDLLCELEPQDATYAVALQEVRKQLSQQASDGQGARSEANRHPIVVLVVDDDEDITRAVADTFQAEGWRTRRAHNLQEALLLGTQRPLPTAAVYDYMIGDITGLEVRDELTRRWERGGHPEPPYVMLTARDNPITEQYVTRQGARAYVLKLRWLDPELGLTAALRKVLRG